MERWCAMTVERDTYKAVAKRFGYAWTDGTMSGAMRRAFLAEAVLARLLGALDLSAYYSVDNQKTLDYVRGYFAAFDKEEAKR